MSRWGKRSTPQALSWGELPGSGAVPGRQHPPTPTPVHSHGDLGVMGSLGVCLRLGPSLCGCSPCQALGLTGNSVAACWGGVPRRLSAGWRAWVDHNPSMMMPVIAVTWLPGLALGLVKGQWRPENSQGGSG